jgi:hypothetical protein
MNELICSFNPDGDLPPNRLVPPAHGAGQSPGSAQYNYKGRGRKNSACVRKFNIVALSSMLLLSACATTPAPQAALQAAELAITSAEQARVADYAAPELGEARSKLNAARTAVQEKDMVLAERLAEQSRLGAELAIARAEVAKTKTVNDEMQKSTDVIQQEMQRKTGIPQ